LNSGKKQKVLVIGLDGATFDILLPLMERGLLKNIKHLIGQGASGVLDSVNPPMSGPGWVSFMTGKNPGRHGIYDFHRFLPGKQEKKVVNFNDIKARSLWEVLTHHGKKIGVINVPITYPPYPVNGFMITGLLTPPNAGGRRIYPSTLNQELTEKFGKYIDDVWWAQYESHQKVNLLRDLMTAMDQKQEITRYLMREKEWDFLMTVITETDRLQHAFGNYLLEAVTGKADQNSDLEIRTLIDRFYTRMDEHVGELCREAGEGTSIFIISDHGFGNTSDFFLVNRWLESQGLLKVKEGNYLKNLLIKSIREHLALRKVVRGLDPLGLRKRLRKQKVEACEMTDPQYHTLFTECIEWSKTVAYMDVDDQQGIYINLKGREPYGIVDPDDYEMMREKIIDRLRGVLHPETGKPLASYVKRREEVYKGEYVEEAPDLVLCLNGFETYGIGLLGLGLFKSRLFAKPFWPLLSAHHRMEGILIAAGPAIQKQMKIRCNLIDLFPTILYAMGLPIPTDLDGKVIQSIFTEAYVSSSPIRWQETSAWDQVISRQQDTSWDENQKIGESLRGLGYF